MTIPFWGRRLPRALAAAALPEPAVPPGAQHLNPWRILGSNEALCPGCHARQDESMPLRERMRLSNSHTDECPARYARVVWK